MLREINSSFTLLASQPAAVENEVAALRKKFVNVPEEYLALLGEATELELLHSNGNYLRIWGPSGCIEMDEGYGIAQRIPGALPIGDDGGGRVILYMTRERKAELYLVGYGDLDADDAILVAGSLTSLLIEGEGIERF